MYKSVIDALIKKTVAKHGGIQKNGHKPRVEPILKNEPTLQQKKTIFAQKYKDPPTKINYTVGIGKKNLNVLDQISKDRI